MDLKPRDIVTRKSIWNAVATVMATQRLDQRITSTFLPLRKRLASNGHWTTSRPFGEGPAGRPTVRRAEQTHRRRSFRHETARRPVRYHDTTFRVPIDRGSTRLGRMRTQRWVIVVARIVKQERSASRAAGIRRLFTSDVIFGPRPQETGGPTRSSPLPRRSRPSGLPATSWCRTWSRPSSRTTFDGPACSEPIRAKSAGR